MRYISECLLTHISLLFSPQNIHTYYTPIFCIRLKKRVNFSLLFSFSLVGKSFKEAWECSISVARVVFEFIDLRSFSKFGHRVFVLERGFHARDRDWIF